MAYRCGLTAADLDNWNVGLVLDYINEYVNTAPGKKGKADIDEKYTKMKKLRPLVEERYQKGEYPQEKYEKFMEFIKRYEEEMG